MVNAIIKTLLAIGVLLLFACVHSSTKIPVPALISDIDSGKKIELQKAIAQLLNQEVVSIANDAFQNHSFVTIERLTRQDSQGNRIQGRELDLPEKIQLILIDGECILKRESNNRTVKLDGMTCVPEKRMESNF